MASYDPQGNPYDASQTPVPPRPGMSTATKVILIVLASLGGLGLLCCGVGGFFLYRFGGQITKGINRDPAVVQEVTQKLATITIPQPLKPIGSIDIQFLGVKMTGVAYADRDSQSVLELMSAAYKDVQPEPGDVRRQIEPQLENLLRQEKITSHPARQGNWESESSTKTIKAGDEEVRFVFTKHTNKDNGAVRIDVDGDFPGTEGTTSLFLSADTKALSEEQIVKMLESINAKTVEAPK